MEMLFVIFFFFYKIFLAVVINEKTAKKGYQWNI